LLPPKQETLEDIGIAAVSKTGWVMATEAD
jgi:hypothetical protein